MTKKWLKIPFLAHSFYHTSPDEADFVRAKRSNNLTGIENLIDLASFSSNAE